MSIRGFFIPIARTIVIVAVPILLTVGAVRLVMSPWFLYVEYNRPGFPEDPFGFTTEQRLQYAPPAVTYLTNAEDISYLENLRLPRDLAPINICEIAPENPSLCYQFNDRELKHMEDVKVVTRGTFQLGLITLIITIPSIVFLWQQSPAFLRVALHSGSVLTFSLIAVIILMAITAWDVFFTGFHQIFFEGDTWLFRYSDTLIRLFPEQFWFDAAIVIGAMVIIGAGIILVVTWRWGARTYKMPDPVNPSIVSETR
jgi:integral membrane protein (TIGR01906 family)